MGIIAMDFDGVLANTVRDWIRVFNEDYSARYGGRRLSNGMIKDWDFWKKLDVSRDDFWAILNRCWQRAQALEPTEFMLNRKTATMRDMCGGLDIVTAIPPVHRESVEAFLNRHDIQHDGLIFETDKEKLDHEVYVDDSPENAQRIAGAGKTVLLYNQPWNRDVVTERTGGGDYGDKGSGRIIRVYGMDHAIHVLGRKDGDDADDGMPLSSPQREGRRRYRFVPEYW